MGIHYKKANKLSGEVCKLEKKSGLRKLMDSNRENPDQYYYQNRSVEFVGEACNDDWERWRRTLH